MVNLLEPSAVTSGMPQLPSRLRSPLVLVAVALLVVGPAACGSDDDDSSAGDNGSTTAAPDGGGDDSGGEAGTIVAKDFELSDLTVAPGAEIVLENQDGATHTATADDDSFDTGEVPGGEISEPVMAPEEPGEYPFHCEIHANMKATLTVEG